MTVPGGRRLCLLLAAAAVPATLAAHGAALTQADLLGVLDRHGISYDASAVEASAALAALRAVDPGARILSKADADFMAGADTIVKSEEWPEGIGYLKLNGLYERSADEVEERLTRKEGAACAGWVVDLRGAGGDSLPAVDRIAAFFTEGTHPLYRVRTAAGGGIETHRPSGDARRLQNTPVMLLIDQRTTEASEILALVLKSCGGVMLIGTPTAGDACLRRPLPLSDSEVLYIAAAWLVPADSAAGVRGVEPDILISNVEVDKSAVAPLARGRNEKAPSEKTLRDRELMERVAGDPALGRATDMLLGLKALGLYRYGSEPATHTSNPPE